MDLSKLYCPDFRSVFGEKFANPFWLSNIDSQIWPILTGIELPKETQNLLKLELNEHPMFYRRKINLKQLLVELESGSFGTALVQSLVLGRKYGIPNKLTLEVAKLSKRLAPIISVIPSKSGLGEVKILKESYEKHGGIAGVVIYPAYQDFDILDKDVMGHFCEELGELNLPLKIDVSDLRLPEQNLTKIEPSNITTLIKNAISWNNSINIIISGISSISELSYYTEALKWNKNVYLEFNHRSLGGISPAGYLKKMFGLPGFVNNYWDRILFGSGTPTLEPSQMMRGLIDAINEEDFSFAQGNLLKAWGFRNGWRIFNNQMPEYSEIDKLSAAIKPIYELKSEHQVDDKTLHLGYDISLQSFSITQLLSFQSTFEQIFKEIKSKYPKAESGNITVKSYHTTTSLIVNEHEVGNFLQLHYYFAEKTRDNPDDKLHTVAAVENRADFNFPDHITASTHGQRSITYPIRNGGLVKGRRENLYALVTFGPRKVHISVDFMLSLKL